MIQSESYCEINMITSKWNDILGELDFAFQPIVNSFTGETFAVEALLRGVDRVGFESVQELFDNAYEDSILFNLDLSLRRKAAMKFVSIPFYKKIKLFYNYDPRVLEMPDYIQFETEKILDDFGIKHDNFCFEINERFKINCFDSFNSIFDFIKKRGIKVAIDDFGSGFAGLELFYNTDPDFIKFDKFLINQINVYMRKKVFCSNIINLSRLLGATNIAEGVETEEEFHVCRDLGFELMQGFFIQKPVTDIYELSFINEKVSLSAVYKRRDLPGDAELISREVVVLDTVNIDDTFASIFDKFSHKLQYNFFPLVDSGGYPVGIIHEKNIKKYVYSPYGKDLLNNKSITKSIKEFAVKCPVADINTPQDVIIEMFVANSESEGVLITKDLKYFGFLSAKSLLNIINEKNIFYAREMNPLTKLPGNVMISSFIDDTFCQTDKNCYYIYMDFDNFKPFNDRFGFRQGDKIITIFAEILRREIKIDRDSFIGHVGGDDFFIGLAGSDDVIMELNRTIADIIKKFADTAATFYDRAEFNAGFYRSKDRYGVEREFELLSVSAALLHIRKGERNITKESVSEVFAGMKSSAKKSKDRIFIKTV